MFVYQFFFLILLLLNVIAAQNIKEINDNVQMQVRAVFMNCDLNENDDSFPESESTRFAQEELFKHGSLTNCNKKLALTVKMYGETDVNFGDEYIPIEHVINGPSKRRTRLLNPYVLRLRRELPLQAYELRRIDTVSGIITSTDYEENSDNLDIKRHARDSVTIKKIENNMIEDGDKLSNLSFFNRYKREYSNDMEQHYDDRTQMWIVTDNLISDIHNFQQPVYENNNKNIGFLENDAYNDRKINHRQINSNYKKSDQVPHEAKKLLLLDNKRKTVLNLQYNENNFTTKHFDFDSKTSVQTEPINNNIDGIEKAYALYEIGNPDMWSTVHVQLFEKLTSPDGHTIWNDITKGELASVSSSLPEWGNENMNIKYQGTEWVTREDFTLPTKGLCLLTPIQDSDADHLIENISFVKGQEYFVLPKDAIITLEGSSSVIKRSNNDSLPMSTEYINNEQSRRRVQIRLSRALFTGADDKMSIASRGTDRFLTIPYRQPSRGQIDLEAKADENQLVTVGAVVRECHPALSNELDNNDSEKLVTDRILIPPKHTRQLKLQIANKIPVDSSHCSVALINDFDAQVAVRDVIMRKGDRCFCVWHCDCVCLGEDPKLLCREMSTSRLLAAGLSSHNRKRHARSVCYKDIVSIDLCITIIGVITTLLLLGLLKALIGLFVPSVRNWGLDCVLQTPRKLEHYYEKSLSSRPVEYDADGWPVHPDTKKRTVRFVSGSMEFILNTIYFIIAPCLLVRNTIRTIITRCKNQGKTEPAKAFAKDPKKCFSSRDMQSVQPRWRHRRGGLRRWMTPQAEELSADLWRKAFSSRQPIKRDIMQPLLHGHHYHNVNSNNEGHESCVDSDQDDTEYVLMEMQKSRESLRRSQRKLNESGGLSSKNDAKRKDLSRVRNN
ncbi:uncharacterized protein LOC115445132 isoform X3 [Manduca sexta]|uniref:uncharacterized protein LOC115445132 isoform X3 n=1 Tax=Manduca sexta TaxID=7130 RepID=UPI001890446B|nr:uncharacterized protein LOC115445132 isoform X3 [Manduca sexta]